MAPVELLAKTRRLFSCLPGLDSRQVAPTSRTCHRPLLRAVGAWGIVYSSGTDRRKPTVGGTESTGPTVGATSLDTPDRIIGDKAYDSDALHEDLDDECIEMIAPHRRSRRPENVTQDGRSLRRYRRRWTVERTISWFQHFRRLCIRYEKSTMLFQGFLHLGCSIILLKQVLG